MIANVNLSLKFSLQFTEAVPKEVVDRAVKKGAKGRSRKKSVPLKYTKDVADKKEEISKKDEDNQTGKVFHKFF